MWRGADALGMALRRRRAVGKGSTPINRHGRHRTLAAVVATVSLLEVAAVHLLLHGHLWWQLLADLVGLAALVFVAGSYAVQWTHPHWVSAHYLVLATDDGQEQRIDLVHVTAEHQLLAAAPWPPTVVADALVVGSGQQVSVEVLLHPALETDLAGEAERVQRVRFWADDPASAVNAIRAAAHVRRLRDEQSPHGGG